MPPVSAQIVIPVHSLDRPLRRAVGSVLLCPEAGALIVAHGLEPATLDVPESSRVQVEAVKRSVGFPGVAFNEGLRAATAPLVGIMGSDDWYEDGAISAMLEHAEQDSADGVIAPIRYAAKKGNEITPTTWRRRNLRPARDHMYYRTAPLGLYKREIFDDPDFLFAEHVPAGTDVVNGVALWSSELRFSYYPHDPAYVVGDDALSRVTTIKRPLAEHAAEWRRIWDSQQVQAASRSARKALAHKMVVQHVLPLIANRPDEAKWRQGDFAWLVETARQLVEEVPTLPGTINRAKRPVFDSLLEGNLSKTLESERSSQSAGYLDWRLASNPLEELGVTSSRRRVLASKLSAWRSRQEANRSNAPYSPDQRES